MKQIKPDLINRDMTRCNDYNCPIKAFCARHKQMFIDYDKGETRVSINDFKGREKVGLCDHFLNIK